MARARNIKPSFFMNEDLVTLPYEYRLLFIGLWTLSDREGLIEDRPIKIKMELFPADSIDINDGLNKLEILGFIERYTESNIKIISILNFKKHQSPHHSEKGSVLPKKQESQLIETKEEMVDAEIIETITVDLPYKDGRNRPDSLNPESFNLNPEEIGQIENDLPKPTKSNNGTRLPYDFVMPDDWLIAGKSLRPELPHEEIILARDKFIDYWHSATGGKATKRDWLATWRNWIRSHTQRLANIHKFPDRKPSMQARVSQEEYWANVDVGPNGGANF